MTQEGLPKPNNLAVAGFLLPFGAAGIAGVLILWFGENIGSFQASLFYLTLAPLVLVAGLVCSLKSIPLIAKLGDADYAYSGLSINIVLLMLYIISVIWFLSPSR